MRFENGRHATFTSRKKERMTRNTNSKRSNATHPLVNTGSKKISLTEKINVSDVKNLMNNKNANARYFCGMKAHDTVKVDENGEKYYEMTTTYKHGASIDFGRLYAPSGSLQGCPGFVRRLTSHKYYVDIDMANAFPTIFACLCEKYHIPHPNLRNYIDNREQIFLDIQETCKLTRDELKTLFLISLHGGKRYDEDGKKKPIKSLNNEVLTDFNTEIKAIGRRMMDLPVYNAINIRLKADKTKKNKLGTFISWVCQEQEGKILLTAKEFFEERGMTVGVLIFDGLQVLQEDWGALMCPLPRRFLLDSLSDVCFQSAGIRVKFEEKPMEPTEIDHERAAKKCATGIQLTGEMAKEVIQMQPLVLPCGRNVLHPIKFEEGVRCVAINASMGLGKSHQCCEFLKKVLDDDPEAGVIFVSARMQQANTIMGQLKKADIEGFQCYKDEGFDVWEAKRMVIQYESVNKIPLEYIVTGLYKYIFTDENLSVCSQITAQTNGRYLRDNYRAFRLLHQHAQKVVLLDAFMYSTGLCYRFLKSIFKKKGEVKFLNYNHVAMPRTVMLQSKEKFMKKLETCIIAGHRIAVACRLKTDMQELAYHLRTLVQDKSAIIEISRDTPDMPTENNPTSMLMFRDINTHLETYRIQVMLFTTKLTVGADITIPFHNFFYYGGVSPGNGPNHRDAWQQCGRTRDLIDPTIYACLPKKISSNKSHGKSFNLGSSTSYGEELRRLTQMQSTQKHLNDIYIGSDPELVQGKLHFSPTSLMEIAAASEAENNEDFTSAFLELARQQNYKVELDDSVVLESEKRPEEMKKAKSVVKKQKDADRRTAWDLVKLFIYEELSTEKLRMEKIRNKGKLSECGKLQLEYIKVCFHFPDTYQEMNLKDVVWVSNNMKTLVAAKWIVENKPKERKSHELYYMANVCGMPEKQAKFMHKSLELVERVLRGLGLTSIRDKERIFTTKDFKHMDLWIRLLDDSCAANGGRDQTNSKHPKWKKFVLKLRHELEMHGFSLVAVHNNGKVTYHVEMHKRTERLLNNFHMDTEKRIMSGEFSSEDFEFVSHRSSLRKRKYADYGDNGYESPSKKVKN